MYFINVDLPDPSFPDRWKTSCELLLASHVLSFSLARTFSMFSTLGGCVVASSPVLLSACLGNTETAVSAVISSSSIYS